jgi:hypothetical protein
MPGTEAGIVLNLKPTEVATAETNFSGPSIPDANGTPTPGTMVAGQLVKLVSGGTVDLATQATLGTDMPLFYMVVFSGDNDYSGAYTGKVNCIHGGIRIETDKFDAAAYAAGLPVVPSSSVAGNFALKGAANDNIQMVGLVGPKGQFASKGSLQPTVQLLDVILPQGSGI